jgi:hypothetical protein
MSGWGILATREHGPKIAFGVMLAILLGAGFVYAEAERMVTSLVSDDIQDEIERGGLRRRDRTMPRYFFKSNAQRREQRSRNHRKSLFPSRGYPNKRLRAGSWGVSPKRYAKTFGGDVILPPNGRSKHTTVGIPSNAEGLRIRSPGLGGLARAPDPEGSEASAQGTAGGQVRRVRRMRPRYRIEEARSHSMSAVLRHMPRS